MVEAAGVENNPNYFMVCKLQILKGEGSAKRATLPRLSYSYRTVALRKTTPDSNRFSYGGAVRSSSLWGMDTHFLPQQLLPSRQIPDRETWCKRVSQQPTCNSPTFIAL